MAVATSSTAAQAETGMWISHQQELHAATCFCVCVTITLFDLKWELLLHTHVCIHAHVTML